MIKQAIFKHVRLKVSQSNKTLLKPPSISTTQAHSFCLLTSKKKEYLLVLLAIDSGKYFALKYNTFSIGGNKNKLTYSFPILPSLTSLKHSTFTRTQL